MLTYYKGLNSDIQGYQKEDYATNEIIQTLAGNYQVSMEYLADNQEAANAAYERLSTSYEQMRADYEAACEAREDAGRAEIIMGLAAVVVGTAAIICTAGAATLVVVALGVTAGAGSVMYGVSNITEGGQEVYYGATGDLESASWNPIRDTVFCGNQSAYDAWGNLNMTIAGLCIPISGAVAQSAAQGGTAMAKTVAVTTAKELFKDKVSDFAVAGIVGAMDQQFDLNQTEQALWTIGLNVGLDKLGDGVSARFKNTASTSPISTDTVQNLKAVEYGSGIDVASGAAKVDVDVKPLDGGAAGIGKNADGNLQSTDFVSGMSASDAARYNAWVDSCINGTHNGYPGLSVDDIAKFEIADAHVAEAIAVSKVDADAYLNLKAVEYGSGIKNVAEAPKAEVDIKPLEGATVGSESGKYSNLGNMSFEDGKKYSSWSSLRKEGLSYEQVEKIKVTPKGQKPSPETYLSNDYINNHLQTFKESGAVKIMPNEPTGTIGGKGGTFVMSGDELNEIIQYADGDVSKIETILGLDQGYLGKNPVIVSIEDTSSLRIPSGNELGAWPEYWEPGGYTSGGIKEAVVNPAAEGTYTYKHLFE